MKFKKLKTGSLKKPSKDCLEIIGEVLTQPKPEARKGKGEPAERPETEMPGVEDETEPVKVIETLGTDATIPDPIFRTAEQEEALEKLRTKIFELEEPYYELEQLGKVLKSMSHGDDDVELSGIFVMGRVVHERAHMIRDIFIQMVGLLKEIRIRGDASVEEKADLKNNRKSTEAEDQKVA